MVPRGKALQALKDWLRTVTRDQRWCIVINADPDAMGAAAALKRIMAARTRVDIYRINEITRPDNLAFMRYLHMDSAPWKEEYLEQYTHFAIVDGQPHHHGVAEYFSCHVFNASFRASPGAGRRPGPPAIPR